MRLSRPWVLGVIAVAAGLAASWLLPRARPWLRERSIRAAPARPDVLLVTLDTTRADRLGCYEGAPGTTPTLDSLARGGVLFKRAYTHVPTTLAAHASLFTGVTPARHGVHENGIFVLDGTLPTLAEALRGAGYRTGAFVSAAVLDRRYGLARGFEEYGDEMGRQAGGAVLAERRAQATVDQALGFLKQGGPRPTFTWVHLYDAHHPYAPPEPFASRFAGRPYDGEIAYMDAELGRLLESVAAGGRPTIVAVLADHGESLGEHQEPTHAFFVYGATQHVPLILSFPGVLPAGRTVEALVRTTDVLPTVMELAGLAPAGGIDGRTLIPLVTGRSASEPGPAYQEAFGPRLFWGAQEVLGIRTGRWLYVEAPRPELYDVEEDPAETVNLAAEKPEELDRLRALLGDWRAKGDPLTGRIAPDADSARRLQALGYLGGGTGAPTKGEPLADAKDVAPLLSAVAEAEDLLARQELGQALEAYRNLVARAPASVSMRTRVAETLLRLEQFDDAYETYRALAEEHPDVESHVIGMARVRLRQGRAAQAILIVRDALKRFPKSPALHHNAGTLLEALGRLKDAEPEYAMAAELDPRDPGPRLALAHLLDEGQRTDEAVRWYAAALEADPSSPAAERAGGRLAALAEGFARAGRLEPARTAYAGAIRARSATAEVYLNAALVSFQLKALDDAARILASGAERFPSSVDIAYRLGRVQAERQDPRAAEAAYVRALALDANRRDVRLALGRALEAQGRVPEAVAVYEQLASGKPPARENEAAASALQRLRSRGGP